MVASMSFEDEDLALADLVEDEADLLGARHRVEPFARDEVDVDAHGDHRKCLMRVL
jgi:hypothetical protein